MKKKHRPIKDIKEDLRGALYLFAASSFVSNIARDQTQLKAMEKCFQVANKSITKYTEELHSHPEHRKEDHD